MRVIGWLLLGLLAIFAAYCLLLAVSALLVSTKKEYRHDSPFYRWLLDSSIRLAVPILRIHVDVRGLEQLPQDTPVFFVGNHRSNFDPILTWYVLRKYRIGYLSKAENFRIPLYGRIIRRCGCTAIDRENPRNAVVTIRAAADRLQAAEGSVGRIPGGYAEQGGSRASPLPQRPVQDREVGACADRGAGTGRNGNDRKKLSAALHARHAERGGRSHSGGGRCHEHGGDRREGARAAGGGASGSAVPNL